VQRSAEELHAAAQPQGLCPKTSVKSEDERNSSLG
jgi:hypothetical protein